MKAGKAGKAGRAVKRRTVGQRQARAQARSTAFPASFAASFAPKARGPWGELDGAGADALGWRARLEEGGVEAIESSELDELSAVDELDELDEVGEPDKSSILDEPTGPDATEESSDEEAKPRRGPPGGRSDRAGRGEKAKPGKRAARGPPPIFPASNPSDHLPLAAVFSFEAHP